MKVGACEWILIENRDFKTDILQIFQAFEENCGQFKFELLELNIVTFS